jgi:hypothetical protein
MNPKKIFDFIGKKNPKYDLENFLKSIEKPDGKFQLHFPPLEILYKLIDDPSEELQLWLIERYPLSIGFIKNPSEELQLRAVNKNIYIIGHIKNPSEEVQLYVVNEEPWMITRISNPTERVQLTALKKDPDLFITNPDFFKDIKNKTEKVIKYYNQITKSNES